MDSEKNTEIAVRKTSSKFLSILTIINERAMQYRDIKPLKKEIKKHIPKGLLEIINDLNSKLVEGISPEQKDFDAKMTERFNRYLRNLGPDSLEVAEAVADPSLERVDVIVKDITQVLSRYLGVNPFPVLKNKMPFYIVSPGGNLSGDEELDRRVADVNHVLAKEGKTLDSVSDISFDDIMRIREQVQKRGKTLEPREFYEEKIAEKYAQFMINLSRQITPRKVATPELDKLSELLQENLPRNISANERKAALKELKKGGLAEYTALLSKILTLKTAEQFMSCAIDDDYLNCVRKLTKMGGVDVEMDGKNYYVSPLDYIALGKKHMAVLKKLKDYLVDIAMEKGLDKAVTNESINEGLRFAYGGDKDAYINHRRFERRVEGIVAQSIIQQRRIPLSELTSDPVYKQATKMIDQQIELMTQQVFSS